MSTASFLITLAVVGALFYFGLASHRNDLQLQNAPKHEQAQAYRARIDRAEDVARKANEAVRASEANVRQGMQQAETGAN